MHRACHNMYVDDQLFCVGPTGSVAVSCEMASINDMLYCTGSLELSCKIVYTSDIITIVLYRTGSPKLSSTA